MVFLFTGQGAQYPGMARATYFNEPVFSRELDRCSELLGAVAGIPPDRRALSGRRTLPDLNQTSLAQPALFAVAYAQAKLWMSWGVKPSCMLGHSIGEYVAAVLAGVFSLEDALRLVAERGRLMQSMEPGSMLAVMQPQAEVERLLEKHPALDLAACNAPELCVVAGPAEAIAAFVERSGRAGDRQPAAAYLARLPLADDGWHARRVRLAGARRGAACAVDSLSFQCHG